MSINIAIRLYTNSDDAFVAWAPSGPIAGCRGFMLERKRKEGAKEVTEVVENRVGFTKDKPKSGEHRPSNVWPFQRFNWTDHVVDVGAQVRYRVTAMRDTGSGRPFKAGPASPWTPWARLSPVAGTGFSCFFNRGLVLSQFVARYLKEKKITAAKLKSQLKTSPALVFRHFLMGDLGGQIFSMLKEAGETGKRFHAALYELGDRALEDALIALNGNLELILANGSDKSGDGNAEARGHLNGAGIPTIDRLLGSKGLGHNKFVVLSAGDGMPEAVWTGSTNWSTTGLCTQINNGLLIADRNIARLYREQWERLKQASPPIVPKADFPPELLASNDISHTFKVDGAPVEVWFTRTSDGRDMKALRELIEAPKRRAILFLMFTPGTNGLHTVAAARAKDKKMYVRGVVSTLGTTRADTEKNVLDVRLVASGDKKFKPDRYTVVQPQGVDAPLGPWVAEVTRKDFLSQVGHAIVHSKVLVLDPFSDDPVVVTGSHNFSDSASKNNDENLVIVRGHRALAEKYAVHVMSVYAHYRWRSYVRETLAAGRRPWSALDDDDVWLREELQSKKAEIKFWTRL
jgi:phosphatidylserine/phosphatidylglycerophosphate/cardiolipin synthase-like enzyme